MLDYKKVNQDLYNGKPHLKIINVPSINYVSVRGSGNPNEENGNYQEAVALLYGVSYALKMSYRGSYEIPGFQEYIVPPLEGFWWQEGIHGVDYDKKNLFQWISMIRLPDFVRLEDLEWAKSQVERKKKMDCSKVQWLSHEEGFVHDFSEKRFHHEIYLSNPKTCNPEKMKTIIRHPIK